MKYLLLIAIGAVMMTGCKKNSCVQCARQVASTTQTTTVTTDYNVVYAEFCGKQADTAMTSDANMYAAFIAEHGVTAYSCFYNQ